MTQPSLAPGFVVMRPSILETRRHDLSTFSVGDEAVIEFGPGLLQFLALRTDAGRTVGEGGAFEWTIPVGAAGTAAYAAVEPASQEGANTWSGVSNVVRWTRACRLDETIIASCRVAALGRVATLPYRALSLQRGDLLVEGEFVFVSVMRDAEGLYAMNPRRQTNEPVSARGDAKPRALSLHPPAPVVPEGDEPEPAAWTHLPVWSASAPPLREPGEARRVVLFELRPPRVLRASAPVGVPGAVWEWLYPRDLLRLLGHPLAGGAEPLGRRHHPFGRILEGMGVHAALAIGGGRQPRTLCVEWWSPSRGEEDFRIRSMLRSRTADSAESTHDIYEGQRAVGTVRVETDAG